MQKIQEKCRQEKINEQINSEIIKLIYIYIYKLNNILLQYYNMFSLFNN